METVKRSTLRTEQAAQTRARILRAASSVFAESGFGGTRIDDIADAAGVAVPTVYKAFANKRNIFVAALNSAMSGTETERIDQQDWWTEQLEEPDPERQLKLIARNARQIYERAAPLLVAAKAAAPADPDLAEIVKDIDAERTRRSQRTAKALFAKASSRVRLSRPKTTLTLLALTDVCLFTSVINTGVSADDYERWLGEVLVGTLLRDTP